MLMVPVSVHELSVKVGDDGIGWHIKALFTRRRVPLAKIFLGCMPVVVGMPGFIALMAAFPQIALVLVR